MRPPHVRSERTRRRTGAPWPRLTRRALRTQRRPLQRLTKTANIAALAVRYPGWRPSRTSLPHQAMQWRFVRLVLPHQGKTGTNRCRGSTGSRAKARQCFPVSRIVVTTGPAFGISGRLGRQQGRSVAQRGDGWRGFCSAARRRVWLAHAPQTLTCGLQQAAGQQEQIHHAADAQ